jgi:hypothetical protein
VHEFHDTEHRGMSDHRQPERGLLQPSFGDRRREQHLVLVVSLSSRKELIDRGAGLAHLPVDERAVLTGSAPARAGTAMILRSLAASFTVAAQADSFMEASR